jgi:hypothetical protein
MSMEPSEPEFLDERVESLLRRSQPRPRPDFVRSLQARLLPERGAQRWALRPRPAFVAAFSAAATALAVLVLSLAGVGPLASGGGQDVKAGSNCRFVVVKERTSVPTLVRARNGQTRIVYRDQLVDRRVRRCS